MVRRAFITLAMGLALGLALTVATFVIAMLSTACGLNSC